MTQTRMRYTHAPRRMSKEDKQALHALVWGAGNKLSMGFVTRYRFCAPMFRPVTDMRGAMYAAHDDGNLYVKDAVPGGWVLVEELFTPDESSR